MCDFPYLEPPKPARNFIPDWYKKTPQFVGGNPLINNPSVNGSKTVKLCIPFLDILTSGYIVELWQDMQVTQLPTGPRITWGTEVPLVETRDKMMAEHIEIPHGHDDTHFVWYFPYSFKTPKGYSVLFSQPFNRYDLPFTTLSAIIDTDDAVIRGRIPFFIKKDFEGIIPAGTPIAQIIPFKRDEWTLVKNPELLKIANEHRFKSMRVTKGFYKNNLWKKKKFN